MNLHGNGANFKSTFLRGLREAMGDYAVELDPDVFVARTGRGSVSDKEQTAVLQGARLATAEEFETGNAMAEAQIKAITAPTITTQA